MRMIKRQDFIILEAYVQNINVGLLLQQHFLLSPISLNILGHCSKANIKSKSIRYHVAIYMQRKTFYEMYSILLLHLWLIFGDLQNFFFVFLQNTAFCNHKQNFFIFLKRFFTAYLELFCLAAYVHGLLKCRPCFARQRITLLNKHICR